MFILMNMKIYNTAKESVRRISSLMGQTPWATKFVSLTDSNT